tara:strand:- start:717 stop:3974 length:3258 start_codon:yes stop_codon:yes gene_type:complete
MNEEEYKSKVEESKKVVTDMISNAKENNLDLGDLENDIEEYLKIQGLNEFDLKTDGNRQKPSYYKAFTNRFNTRFMEILQQFVPEIINIADVRKFTIWDMEKELEREKELKKNVEGLIENMFVKKIIPQMAPLIDQGYTASTLGERMADQAGEDLINFLPLIAAPQLIANAGPAQGMKLVASDPSKLKNFFNVLNNSVKSIINQYVSNPGKAVTTDVAAIAGFGAGTEFGEAVTEAAGENKTEGTYDLFSPVVELGTGLTGATTAVGTALTLGNPKKTINAAGSVFKNWFGLKPAINFFTKKSKQRQENQAIKFIKNTLEEPKVKENLETSQKLDEVTGGRLGVYNKDADSGLTLAERTEAPSLTVTQTDIEANLTGTALDKAANRRVNNIQILDDTLEEQIPKSDKEVSYILDLKKNKFNKTSDKIEEEIVVKEKELAGETETLISGTTTKDTGANLRDIISDTQSTAAKDTLDSLNKVPNANQAVEPEILDDLVSIASSREFQVGTDPTSMNPIKQIMEAYLPKTEAVISKETGEFVGTKVKPAEKTLTNQDLFDIWITLGKEESSLLGKSGIENKIKLSKIGEMRGLLLNEIKNNVKLIEGDEAGSKLVDDFVNNLNSYINNFEKGAIVKTQTQTNTGFQLRDELVADSFFQANNVESMNSFIRVFGQNDEAVINMQNSILDRVISKTLDPKTGLINTDKLRLFLTNNESVLNAFSKVSPDFVTTLKNKPDVISSIATRLNVLNKRKNYVEGQKLNEVYTYLGQPGTKQLKFGTPDEYIAAALNDPKVMERIAKEAIEADAGDAWIKAVLDKFKNLRIDKDTGAISNVEIKNLNKFLKTNEKSLKQLFETMGPDYKNHYDNLITIMKGFEKVNLIVPPRGSPAPTPGAAMKDALGTDVPQVWSRFFAIASNRTGYKFVGAELFQRYLNTIGKKHFDKVIQEAIYSPELNNTLANMLNGKEATVKDIKNLYGNFAKIMGTIGTMSEDGDDEYSIGDEAAAMSSKEVEKIEKETIRPNNQSSLSNVNIVPPTLPDNLRVSPVNMSSINPNTMDRGKQLFNRPGEITFASKGGIMNARKVMQRVI